jgi:hypothetical protein
VYRSIDELQADLLRPGFKRYAENRGSRPTGLPDEAVGCEPVSAGTREKYRETAASGLENTGRRCELRSIDGHKKHF